PITKVIDEREHLTGGAMAETKQALRSYEQRLSNYHDQIRAARAKSYQMLEEQRAMGLAERSKILAQVKAEAKERIETKKQEIQAAADQASVSLEADARVMAESISRNLLKRPLGGVPS